MSVFSQESQVLTKMGAELGQSDNSLTKNYKGSVPLDSSITSDTWHPNTNAVDCKIIHGDRWQDISGNMTQHIHAKKTSTYDGEFKDTYNSDVTRDMFGTVTETYYDSENRTHCGKVDETNLDVMTQEDPAPKFEHKAWVAEAVGGEFHTVGGKAEFLGAGATFAGGEVKGVGVGIDVCGLDVGIKGLVMEMNIAKDGFHFAKIEAEFLKNKLEPLLVKLGIMHSKAQAAETSTGAALGPNQVM